MGGAFAVLLQVFHYLIPVETTIHFVLFAVWYFTSLVGLVGVTIYHIEATGKPSAIVAALGAVLIIFGVFSSGTNTYLFEMGWIFLGVGSYFGRKFPRWNSSLWVLAGILGLMGNFFPVVMDTPGGPGGWMFLSFGIASVIAGIFLSKQVVHEIREELALID
jgi:hypothetical protein